MRKIGISSVIGASALIIAAGLQGCGGVSSQEVRTRTLNLFVPATGADPTLNFSIGNVPMTGSSAVAFGQFGNGGRYVGSDVQPFAPTAAGPGALTPLTLVSNTGLAGFGATYTLVAVGQGAQTGTLIPQLLMIPNFTPDLLNLAPTSAAIRVINLSLNPNPIGLYSTTSGIPSAAVAADVGSVAYGYSSTTNAYVLVATNKLTNLALVDTTKPTVALTLAPGSNLNSVALLAGQAYTLYIYGQPSNAAQPLGATWALDFPAL